MASDPWSILNQARSGPTVVDLVIGAKQRRLEELYRQKAMERQDRQDERDAEERAATVEAVTPQPSTAPVEAKKRVASGFGRLSDLSGVGVGAAPPAGEPANAAPAPANFITPSQAQMMRRSMGDAGYSAWQQKHGVTEYDPDAPPRDVAQGRTMPTIPASAHNAPAAPMPMDDPNQPADLLPADAGFRSSEQQGQSGGSSMLSLNPDGLQRLARVNPKLAFELSKMSSDQHTAAFKAIREQVDLESQVIGAVRAAPPADQARVYESIRDNLVAKGVTGLPEQWDPTLAETHQRMGLTAMQAFQDNRAERRFEQDVADDEADNARADRNTDSVVEDRGARRDLVVRGQDLTDSRGRRGQDVASGDHRRGQDMTDKRVRETGGKRKGGAPVIHDVKTPTEAAALPKGSYFRTPDGKVKVRP
jgi:hypothetical protein